MQKQVFVSFVGKVKHNSVLDKALTIHNITETNDKKTELKKYTVGYICDEIGKNNFVDTLDDGKDIVDHDPNNYVMTWGRDSQNFFNYCRIELWWVYEKTLRGWVYNTRSKEKVYVGYFECVDFGNDSINFSNMFAGVNFAIHKTDDSKIIKNDELVLIDDYSSEIGGAPSANDTVPPSDDNISSSDDEITSELVDNLQTEADSIVSELLHGGDVVETVEVGEKMHKLLETQTRSAAVYSKVIANIRDGGHKLLSTKYK